MSFFYARILFVSPVDSVVQRNNRQSVSVIVCAHNELENLKRLIPAILQQEYPDFELLIADDRSTDGSKEYFEKIYQGDSRFKIISIQENTGGKNHKKYALSKAISLAKHDLLLLTDADCLPAS